MSSIYVATFAEGELEVTVTSSPRSGAPGRGAMWTMRIGEEVVDVDAVQLKSGAWSVLVDGRSCIVDIVTTADQTIHVDVAGSRTSLELADAQAHRLAKMLRRGGAKTTKGEAVRAPIAGKVVKVAVEVGDEVAAGESVVVLEAMKMENELAAGRGGTVSKVHVSVGDPVETGQLLVTLS